MVELLSTDDDRTEPHSLGILETRQAQNVWLSRDSPYNRPYEVVRLFM